MSSAPTPVEISLTRPAAAWFAATATDWLGRDRAELAEFERLVTSDPSAAATVAAHRWAESRTAALIPELAKFTIEDIPTLSTSTADQFVALHRDWLAERVDSWTAALVDPAYPLLTPWAATQVLYTVSEHLSSAIGDAIVNFGQLAVMAEVLHRTLAAVAESGHDPRI